MENIDKSLLKVLRDKSAGTVAIFERNVGFIVSNNKLNE